MKIFPQNRAARFLTVIILAAVLFLLFDAGFKFYKQRQGEKRVEELANELKRIEQEIFDKKAADKIGGKTPQETLNLFIAAVEAGDYELASRYFVIERQENTKREFMALSNNNNIGMYLSILKAAKSDGEIKNGHFRMRSKLKDGPPDYFLDFTQYPSGNWKIEEI